MSTNLNGFLNNYNLHKIVESGDIELAKYLIDLDVNLIDTVDELYGRTPLIICASKKTSEHLKIAKYLLDCGCDVNVQANYKWKNWSALMTACFYGNPDMVQLLINANATLQLEDANGSTAWQIAFENYQQECIAVLSNEMDIQSIEARHQLEEQLQDALFNNDSLQITNCLKKFPPESIKQVINSTSSGNHSLLFRVCRNGDLNVVKLLLDHGAIAKPHHKTKYSPLYIACHMGNIDIVQILLENFPQLIQTKTLEKFLPFHAVCSQGHVDILKLLLNFDPQIDKKLNSFDNTVHLQRIFKDANGNSYMGLFDLNALDLNDQSGLFVAVLANRYNIVEYLLNLKVKKLSPKEIASYERKRDKRQREALNQLSMKRKIANSSLSSQPPPQTSSNDNHQPPSNHSVSLSSSSSSPSGLGLSNSLSIFDHLKNVFLDIKSYDPYLTDTSSIQEQNDTDLDDEDGNVENCDKSITKINKKEVIKLSSILNFI
jgi:ankyrin repeat protein